MPKLALYRDDELYLVARGGRYSVHGTVDGRRIRKACGTSDFAKAKLFMERTRHELASGWREDYDSVHRDWREVAEMKCSSQKMAAKGRSIPFDLTPAQVYGLMKATGFRCAVSGVPFAKRFASNGKRDPWAPSIDRIENRQGYTLDNVRVVCVAANLAMSDWGLDVLLRLSRGIVGTSLVVSQELPPNMNSVAEKTDKPLIHLVKVD